VAQLKKKQDRFRGLWRAKRAPYSRE